jgi:aryl-alcohol dehydrogenase-like predicted oxidoreductase
MKQGEFSVTIRKKINLLLFSHLLLHFYPPRGLEDVIYLCFGNKYSISMTNLIQSHLCLHAGFDISQMILGTMYFGSKVSRDTSFRLIDYYYDRGGRVLDSANKYASWINGYRGGESERLIGEWLKLRGEREKTIIISKVGFSYGEIPASLSSRIIISECEKSLKRMETEYIDMYFAHSDDMHTPQQEYMEAFYQLMKAGKIRSAGASNFHLDRLENANQTASLLGWEGFCALQQRYTILMPKEKADFGNQIILTSAMKSYCNSRKISIMAYSPLLGGLFDHPTLELPLQYQTNVNNKKMTLIKKLADKYQIKPNQLVLAYLMSDSIGITPVISGSKIEQITENTDACMVSLSDADIESLKTIN